MANEIQFNLGETGRTVYAVVRNAAGQAWNGSAFVTYTTTRDTFDLALTEIGSTGHYGPIDLPGSGDGRWWELYLQAGGSPSHSDDLRLATGYHTAGQDSVDTANTQLLSVLQNHDLLAGAGFNTATDSLVVLRASVDAVDGIVDTIVARTDVATSTRASQTSVDDVPTNAELATALTNLDATVSSRATPAQVNTEADQALADVGLTTTVTGRIDATVSSRASQASVDTVDGVVDTILVDTNELQADWANGGRLDNILDAVGGGGVTIPVNQVPVPRDRTWVLKATADGLEGELPIIRTVGENVAFAIDFRRDLGTNGRLTSLDSISVSSGPAGGIVISTDPNDLGVDRSQAKCKINLVTEGTYDIDCNVSYDDSDGGGTASGQVTLVVRA